MKNKLLCLNKLIFRCERAKVDKYLPSLIVRNSNGTITEKKNLHIRSAEWRKKTMTQ